MKRVPIILASALVLTLAVGSNAVGAGRGHHPTARGRSMPRSTQGLVKPSAAIATRRVPSAFDCTAAAVTGATNTQLDCDTQLPNDEPNIVVDPTDPLHMVVSSNDYDSCCDEYYTTFDGGLTWSTGNMSVLTKRRTGSDPVTVFETKSGNVLHASLNYGFTKDGQSTTGDVVVSVSTDGGLTWAKPVVAYHGHGADKDPTQVFNDKEWLVADTDPSSPYYGRVYLTWSRFLARHGHYVESPIWMSYSDDGGLSWSAGKEISGSAVFCTFQTGGPAGDCDEDQGSTSVVAPDGTVDVAFVNGQNSAAWETGREAENSYLVVTSADGGATWSTPVDAADLEDGKHDLPLNVDGRQTFTGYQLRIWSVGNIALSSSGTLYVVFADNRAGTHDVPYPVSDMNVYVVSSTDGGATWGSAVGVDTGPSDQWFPWADVNPVTGQLGVLYNDRDPSNPDVYNASLAVGAPGSFTKTVVSAAPSDPTNSLFFQAGAVGCNKCATFHGDYIGLDYGTDGLANMVWTDMSVVTDSLGGDPLPHPRNLQFIFFARD